MENTLNEVRLLASIKNPYILSKLSTHMKSVKSFINFETILTYFKASGMHSLIVRYENYVWSLILLKGEIFSSSLNLV